MRYADHKGRGVEWHGYPEGDELLQKAAELSLSEAKPKDIIMGRHLLDLGIPAGVRHGRIIRELNRLHLDDKINTLEHAQRLAPLLPEFANAKKTGYLFAANAEGVDDVFILEDAKRVYEVLKKPL